MGYIKGKSAKSGLAILLVSGQLVQLELDKAGIKHPARLEREK